MQHGYSGSPTPTSVKVLEEQFQLLVGERLVTSVVSHATVSVSDGRSGRYWAPEGR